MKNFLNFGRRKPRQDSQGEILHRENSPKEKELAAADLNVTSGTLSGSVDQRFQSTKILTVQDGNCSSSLVDYAVKMAHKLDCEIIALDVSEEPLVYEGERRTRETNRFHQRAQRSAETLQLKAEAMGVKCKHVIQIGNQEDTIRALSQEDKTIRYVLTKPAQEQLSTDQRQVRIPVFDLSCSRL